MKLHEALALPCLAGARLVSARAEAGPDSLRDVTSAHVVDLPDPFGWLRPGQLLLTTGMHWPREGEALRAFMRGYARAGVAVLGLAVPQYLEALPEPARQEAELLGLPVLEIPWETPFADIVGGVQDSLLSRQLALSVRAEQVHLTLTRAAAAQLGLAGLCRTLGEVLSRPVEVRGPDLEVLARWGGPHAEGGGEGAGVPGAALHAHLERLGLVRAVWRGSLAQVVPGGHGPGLDVPGRDDRVGAGAAVGTGGAALVCPVWVGESAAATVWALEAGTPLTALDSRALEHAAVVFGLTLAQERATRTLEARLGYSFVDSVLEGRFDGSPQSMERARAVGFGPGGTYRVLLLALPGGTPLSTATFERRERLAQDVRRRLSGSGAAALVTVAQDQVVALLPPGLGAEVWTALHGTADLTGLLSRGVAAGDLPQGYAAVRALLPHAPPGRLTLDSDLLVQGALNGDGRARAALVDRWTAPLSPHPKLLVTLRALVRHAFSLKDTARALSLHANTLRYRLERLEALLGADVTSPDVRFELELALRLETVEHPARNLEFDSRG
ncbi:PucR family transcriptional regulator [Deinococcus aquiradiocola]|uniref:PucR family transcriptional regulator n=1 Tax=Deinococcus aquiradiocola TaxID=393059 RepID=UPI00166C9CFE|nr:PucR family transcriptional regulator [Deinococcus aquiradiocola]